MRPLLAAACSAALIGVTPPVADDDAWPQWRGPDRRGVAAKSSYAEEWSRQKNIAWKAEIEGRGRPSPAFAIRGSTERQ